MNYTEMSHEQIVDEIEKLLTIESSDLDIEAIKNQKIFVTLERMYMQVGRKLAKLFNQKDKVEHARYRFYAGKAGAEHYRKEPLNEAILKTDIPYNMNIDPIVIEIREMTREAESIVKTIEDAKSSLRNRGYDIKNAITFRQLMSGK